MEAGLCIRRSPGPATVCAAFVMIAWGEAHGGEVPGRYNKALWAACAELWRVAGGSRLASVEGGGWKNPLAAVAEIPPALMVRYRRPFQNVRRQVEHGLLGGSPA